jgi:hypothetical protein
MAVEMGVGEIETAAIQVVVQEVILVKVAVVQLQTMVTVEAAQEVEAVAVLWA